MDIETSEAIESVRDDFRRVETTLSAEVGKLRAEMVTRADLASTREELRRHTDVRFESLRDDIRILAEAYASLNTKVDAKVDRLDAKIDGLDATVDRLDAKFDSKFDGLDAKVDRLDAKFDSKFDGLDATVDRLDAKFDSKFDGLEAKIDRLLPPRP